MKNLRHMWLTLVATMLLYAPFLPAALATVSDISGFVSQVDGDTVTSSEWNQWVGGIYTYINNNIVVELNKLNAKGNLLSHDGTSITAITNAGASDNGKVLTFNNAATTGWQLATAVGTAPLTTKGDIIGYSSSAQRIPVSATDGDVLTVDSTNAFGIAWKGGVIPKGGIIAWSPSAAGTSTVPTGWHLCDGNSGRPNLIGRFILGTRPNGSSAAPAGSGFGVYTADSDPGGSVTHAHTVVANTSVSASGAPAFVVTTTSTSAASTMPACYALVYIIKD